MNFWNWFKSKPIYFQDIFGELSSESAKLFYESQFKNNESYRTIEVSLPETIHVETGHDFDTVESFEFPDRPIKQRDHWILGNHIELDTPTIIVDHDYQILLEDLNLDGSRNRTFLAEHFNAFLNYIISETE